MRTRALTRGGAVAAVAAAALGAAGPAAASELLARSVTDARLSVDGHGRALVTYRHHGALKRVVASGAIGARAPSRAVPQVRFRLRYGGGEGFRGRCLPYDGPRLSWLVVACKAPDGSYWALQSWHRLVPRPGARVRTGARELRLSHWRGDLAVLDVGVGWVSGYHRLTGVLSYGGRPVHGFGATPRGRPLDGYGRNVYLDTRDSRYGHGWRRENGFLTHRPTGRFCYGFFPRGGRPSGMGREYRATVIGPGVTPDVRWTATPPPAGATAGPSFGCG